MANTLWLTNLAKANLLTTALHSAANFYMGLLCAAGGTVPTAIDTEAEIQDSDTITQLLAFGSVVEATGGSYVRQNLSSSTVTEDDTNNRANCDFANATFTAVPGTNNPSYGGFISRGTGVNGDTFVALFIFTTAVTPNGSDITVTITDWLRAT
jgi:hypothetical protein